MADKLIKLVDITNLSRKHPLLDPACGDGQLLLAVAKRIMKTRPADTWPGHFAGMSGWEIDPKVLGACRRNLEKLTKWTDWDLSCRDALQPASKKENFAYCVANPPFIRIQDLAPAYRDFLRKTFKSCKEGNFDMFLSFIELANSCAEKVVAICPASIRTSRAAKALRASLVAQKRIAQVYEHHMQYFKDASDNVKLGTDNPVMPTVAEDLAKYLSVSFEKALLIKEELGSRAMLGNAGATQAARDIVVWACSGNDSAKKAMALAIVSNMAQTAGISNMQQAADFCKCTVSELELEIVDLSLACPSIESMILEGVSVEQVAADCCNFADCTREESIEAAMYFFNQKLLATGNERTALLRIISKLLAPGASFKMNAVVLALHSGLADDCNIKSEASAARELGRSRQIVNKNKQRWNADLGDLSFKCRRENARRVVYSKAQKEKHWRRKSSADAIASCAKSRGKKS